MATNEVSEVMKKAEAMWHDPETTKRYVNAENATRPFGKIIVEKSGLPTSDKEAQILDLATGTGAVLQELYDAVPKEKWGNLKVLGGDLSPHMLDYLKIRGEKAGWTNLETKVLDGNDLNLPDSTYTHIFVSFAIFVMPKVVEKLTKALKPGGFLAVTTWADVSWISLMQDSIAKMREPPFCPSAEEVTSKMYSGLDWGSASFVADHLRENGLENVDTVQKKHEARVGSAKSVLETMQFPMLIFKGFWEESKQEELVKELNDIVYQEMVAGAGGEENEVEMEFEGLVAWGRKPE